MQYGSTTRVDASISAHTGLSVGVRIDHEAQSQVKQKTAAKVKALEEGLTRKMVRAKRSAREAKISVREVRRWRESRESMNAQRCWTNQRTTP